MRDFRGKMGCFVVEYMQVLLLNSLGGRPDFDEGDQVLGACVTSLTMDRRAGRLPFIHNGWCTVKAKRERSCCNIQSVDTYLRYTRALHRVR